jgi:aminopeptidase N
VGNFYRPEVLVRMEGILANEKNPLVVSAAIENMGRFHSPQTQQVIRQYLQSTSYRNELAGAAIQAIRTLDDPSFIPDLMTALREGKERSPSWNSARGLGTLAHIARDQEDRTAVREFIAEYVNHPKLAIRRGAISALGTLGDPGAIPIVETFCGEEPYDPVQRVAKEAMDELQEKKRLVPEEVIELRKTVDELKKETEKLKKDLEDLKKQGQAKAEAPPAADANSPSDSSKVKDDQKDSQEQ